MKGLRISASRFASLIPVGLVLAALVSGALADAQSQPPDQRPHLLLVPDSAEAEVTLERTDARVIARYESFSLVEAAGADDARLRAAGADRRDDMRTVTTAAGELDPRTARRSLAGKEAPERDEVLALVQFVGPPKDSWLERLRATGARIVTYQAENAYVVHAGGDEVERLAALLGGYAPVRAVSVLTAADKLESSHSPSGRYAVQTVTGAEGADARAEASAAGAGVSPSATVGALRTQYLELTDAEAAELARDPAVVAVEPYGEPELADERAAQIVAGNLTAGFGPSGPGYLDWLVHPDRIPDEGTFDFAIDVTDEGLDSGVDPPQHADFRAQGSGASRIAYLNNYSSDGTAADCGGHGTNVASIATGYNQGSGSPGFEDAPSGYNHGLGVAPFARLGASKIFTCGGGFAGGWTPATLASNAYAGSARVTNNSWGTSGVSSWGAYNSRAQQYDAVVRDARAADSGNQEMVEVFAAGNDGDDGVPGETIPNYNEGYGTILAEATAKNVITVGASEGVRASGPDGCGTPDSGADSSRDIVDFSSRGPTDDGRLKPDLVAPGTHVTGARPQHAGYTGYRACTNPFGGPLYTLISGSSQAAPQVSGAAALVRHWYERTRGAEPSPALIKAFLINTATDLAGGQSGTGGTVAAGPNADQGWGRVNLGKAFDSTAREFRDQLPGDVLGASGDTLARSYAVQDTGSPVKVTLAWTDSPGPTIGNAYVNDLDLQVEAGGRTYNGNVFAGAFSRSGGSADTRNNVESVHLPAGTTGPFAVRVVGSNIPGDGVPGNADATDQDFALVVSNADEQASPVLVHDATALDDSLTAGGDGDDALEPGESFELDERLRNAGSADATGVSGVLTGGSDVTITQSTSAWPDLAPGGTAENTTAFEGTVPADTTCGTEVQAGLVLTTAQGPHNVPLTLPTGTEGPLESRTQSHTPGLDIPDDDAVGVTSPITVASAGRIKDLDVRIGDLEHDFVGDLRIDLTGPDGTTVTLAAHPGGPDNPGKDFTNTIFDDEAATSISAGTDPYTGRFRPQNDQLARFDGKQQQGTWTLRVRDLFEGDTGVLRGWGTDTRPAACSVSVAPPQTTIGAGPVEGATVSNPTAIFTFSSSAAGATFECEIDGGNWSSCSSPQTYNGLQDGTHTFRVRAVSLGQTDPTPAKRTWTINTLPDTVIASGPSEMSRVSSTSASFQFESPDTPGATFECSLDGAAFAPCTDPSGLPDGNHTIAARARNAAGKVDASPAIRNWTVDTVGPISSVSGPTGSIVDSEPTLTGRGGTLAGDAGTVTVRVYPGGGHPDPPVAAPSHTLTAPVAPGSGQWSVDLPSPVSGLGPHTVQVEQVDVAGNTRRSARSVFNVVTDAVAPTLTLTAPTSGSTTTNRTPTLAGVAGTAPGDDGTVAVKLWSGTLAAGLPTQTLFVPRDATTGAFSAQPSALPDGSYTVRAEQGDAALPTENVGVSNAAVFGLITAVDPPRPADPTAPATPAPSVVAAPVEERLSDALAGRYTVSAACASACRVSAGLSLASSAARRLGLSARSRAIGGGSKRLTRAGSASMRLKLTRAARSALGGRSRASATLSVTVTAGADTFALTRKITLSRSAGLRTVVRRGLGLWAVCSRRCPLSGELTVSSTEARRLGLKPGRSARMGIASGHVRATAQPARVTLRLGGKVKKAVARARRLHARLELAGGSAPDNDRTAARTLTLRR